MHGMRIRAIALAGCLSALAAVSTLAAGANAGRGQDAQSLEVAEIGSRYVPLLLPGQEQPVRGTTFITEGYLYPKAR